jgi:hypothetical protein
MMLVPLNMLFVSRRERTWHEHESPLAALLPLVQLLFSWVAVWWITTPEPGVVEPPASVRRCARVAGSLVPPMALLLRFYTFSSSLAEAVAGLTAALTAVGGSVLWYAYVRRLALRLPSPGLAFQSLVLLWASLITLLFALVLPWLATGLRAAGVDTGALFYLGIEVRGLAWLGLVLYATYFCFLLRRAFVVARSEAASRDGSRAVAGAE